MLSKSELSQAVANLINSGLTPVDAPNLPPEIRSEDVYPSLRPFFTDKAGKILHNRINNTIHQRNEISGHEGLVTFLAKLKLKKAIEQKHKHGYTRVIDIVNSIGLSTDGHNLAEATSKVITTINDLADKGYITAAMAPLSIIELHPSAWPENRYCVISYLAVTSAGQIWVDNNLQQFTFKEGGVPTNIKDLK